MHWNLINDEEFASLIFLKLKYRWGDQIIQTFQNWFPPETGSPIFNLWKFQDSEKGTPESRRMHASLMNDKEFGSLKLLKLKYRKGDQIIQLLFRIGSSQEINPHKFNHP